MYSVAGLENGILLARKNIEVLETAIERERQTIKEYRIMIDDLEQAESLKEEAALNVRVEVVEDGDTD